MIKYQFVSSIDGNTYYSVFAHACDWTWIELFSDDIGTQDPADFEPTDVERFYFSEWNDPKNLVVNTTTAVPISMSRAVTDFDSIKEFYGTIMGGTTLREVAFDDGSEWLTMNLPGALTHIEFVRRPVPEGSTFTVQEFIDIHNTAHEKYILTPVCGFDQWADDHWAYDLPDGMLIDDKVALFK